MWGVTIRPRGLFIRASLVPKVVFHLPAVKRSNVSFFYSTSNTVFSNRSVTEY